MHGNPIFDAFDFACLNDPAFKEDAVREEILAPILRELGYRPTGDLQVVRSKALDHPYVMIGSKKHPVKIVPDYTLYRGTAALLVLEAKAPNEEIVRSSHVEQVYSYAIHPDVRCDSYALCNGRELALYRTDTRAPVAVVAIADPATRWDHVVQALHHRYLQTPELRNFMPDFGMHALQAGIRRDVEFLLFGHYVQMISKVSDGLYTLAATAMHGESDREYLVSFDMDQITMDMFLGKLPPEVSKTLNTHLSRQPYRLEVHGKIVLSTRSRLGEETEGHDESFVPLLVQEVLDARYNPSVRLEPRSHEGGLP